MRRLSYLMVHGTVESYLHQCRCSDCKRAYEVANRDWVVMNLPLAVIMRKAFSDEEAIGVAAQMP
jgi:hypothetical protein